VDSRRATLLQLLAWDERAKFIIPRWQREYVWGTSGVGEREVQQIWQDLRSNCRVAGGKHFCGVILLHSLPQEAVTSWEIVDGQQRMTTFFLLFIAIRDECERRRIDFSELNNVFTTQTSADCRLVLSEGLNDDRQVLNALLQRSASTLEKKLQDESRIYASYRFFVTRIADEIVDTGMQDFVLNLLQGVDLLILTVDPTDDVRRIFETLNSRGKQVDPYELVANLISYIGDDNNELNNSAQKVWYHVTQILEKDDLDNFLTTFAKRNAQQTPRGTVFDEIKFEIDRAREKGAVRAWLREFERTAKNYAEILDPDDSEDPVQVLLYEIRALRTPKLNPFLLALLEAFRETPASETLIHNVRSLIVRLLISYERPSYKIERFAELACGAFYDQNVSREERLNRVIALIDDTWIADEQFAHAFAMKTIYGPGAHLSRLRYYLEKIEQKLSENSGQPFELHFGSKTTVEHIMPQTLDSEGAWKTSLRIADPVRLEAQHKALVHTIGNLTVLLTTDNPAAGNTPYSQKREFYLHPNETLEKLGLRRRKAVIGTCALNQYFENIGQWNFQAIAERGRYLAGLALEIWSKEPWNREIK